MQSREFSVTVHIFSRIAPVGVLLLCLCGAALPAAETPAESFLSFMKAVLETEKPEAERRAGIERYFDFDAMVADREAAEGVAWDETRREEVRAEWMRLFLSGEFQRGGDVQIVREPEPQGDKAELYVAIAEPGARRRPTFLVKLNRAEGYWRWYSIRPTRDEPPTPRTTEEQLAAVLAELEELRAAQAQIEARLAALEAERQRLSAELAEKQADDAPYSSPMTTARTVGRAIQAADVDALLRAHVSSGQDADHEKLEARLRRESEKIASWEPLDVSLSTDVTAMVRVRVQLWSDTGVKTRVLTLSMRKAGEEWLVDQEP